MKLSLQYLIFFLLCCSSAVSADQSSESENYVVTLRSLVAVLTPALTKNELDGYLNLAKKYKVDLDQKISFRRMGSKLYLGHNLISFNEEKSTFNYRGFVFNYATDKPLDQLAKESQNLFSSNYGSNGYLSLFVPSATAQPTTEQFQNEGMIPPLLIKAIKSSPNLYMAYAVRTGKFQKGWGRSAITVVQFLGLTLATAILAGVLSAIPKKADASTPIYINRATCDANGILVDMDSQGTLQLKLDHGNLVSQFTNMDNVSAVKSEKDMSSEYKTSALSKTKDLLRACAKKPIPTEQFTEIAMATFSNGYSMEPEKLKIKKGRNLGRKEQVTQ